MNLIYFCRPFLVVLLFSLFYSSEISADKLNERRILLPYNSGVPTNFTLEALTTSSCYKWSSSRPDIASVKHIGDPSCSRQAVVTVVSRVPKRQNSVVTAHDLKTNLQIRCDIEIDVINRVLITTTTRQIVFGELPEMIKAVAFDEKNDTFTSIGGIQFDWTISPLEIIHYKSWASSSYSAPDFVDYWESKGLKSSFVLMEGIRTGSAKIKARIMGDAYQDVEPSEINVHVVANLLLIPSNDVFLVRGAKVAFRAEISKQGPRVALNLPLPQYYLEVTEPNIAKFDEITNLLEATEEGQTSLVLRDRNVQGDGLSQTSTDIHVMRPSYLSLQISPGEKFALRNDTVYVISLSLHDDWHHKLYPSDNLNVKIDFHQKFFQVLESTQNGTYYVVRTQKIGTTKLKAQFLGAGSVLLDTPLDHIQEVIVYPPITLNPPQMLLPWIPTIKPTYTVFVDAFGATGEYNWETGNESMAQVKSVRDKSSRATVFTKGDGEVQISCNDVHNSLIFNSFMNIYIRPIEAIEILPSIVETHVGGKVVLPVAVLGFLNGKDGKKVYFDDCAQVNFEIEIVEKNRFRYQLDQPFMPGMGKHSCRSLSFECLASGNSRIWISYGPDKQITTSAIVGCYAPLKLVHPNEFAVMSLGSIIDIAFEGGPRKWSLYPEGHYTKATASNSSVIALTEIKDRYRYNKDLHVFRTKCTDYGESTIDLEVGNVVSPTLANPAYTFSTVKIICAKPETLIIRPRMKETCPQQDLVFTLEKNRNIELDVQVLDLNGNSFYNFSTLYFDWSKDGNGAFLESHGIKEEVNGAKGYFALTRSFQLLSQLTTIRSKVIGRITGYHGSYFGDRFDVRREIELVLTDPLSTEEGVDHISILKHSDYKKMITIKRGSGYFSVVNYTNAITVDYKTNNKAFQISPRSLGTGAITIDDLCLDYPPVQLRYSVVEALDVKVNLIDKIELGANMEGTFYVLDNRGIRLHSSLHTILDFAVMSSNNFLIISDIKPKDDTTTSFTVKADRLGLSKVVIQSQSDKVKSIQSSPIEIQIFSPLQIIPSNITLIVGNHFQANFIGGPQTQRNIEFTIGESSLASVASNGLIKALRIGKTKLTGRVLNVNNLEYSRAEIDVHVVPLKKIKIWTPVNQIRIGSHMPLFLIGSSEQFETPFMFGQADPALKITWSLSNEKIANIESSFQTYGISDSTTEQFAARFQANTIGTVTLKVRVEVTAQAHSRDTEQILKNIVLTDSVQINVYSDFALSFSSSFADQSQELEKSTTKVVLLSPNAELGLHFNHLDTITYKVMNSSQVKVVNNTELVLQAGDQQEYALLLLYRDMHKTGLVEYYSYAIHVDKVRYLSLEFDPKHRKASGKSSTIDVFPIGSELKLVVHYFDNHGRKFDAVKSNLKWILSRNDIITVLSGPQDNTLKIRALKEGSVVMLVSDEVNQVGTYYKINVGSIIEPKIQPISVKVGDIVCLRSKLSPVISSNILDSEEENELLLGDGVWSTETSSDVGIGHISPAHGTFVALNVGKTVVVFNSTSTGLSTYANLVVKNLDGLVLDMKSVEGITTSSSLSIPIVVESTWNSAKLCSSSEIGSLLRYLRANRLLPFTCDVGFENSPITSLWETEVLYNVQRGQWLCKLIPKPGLDLDNLSLFNLNVTLTVMSNLASSKNLDPEDPNFGFDQKTVPFLPSYQSSVKQIILTSDSKEVRFTINSVETVLREMTIKPSNDDILDVKKLEIVDNSLKVLVTLRNADIFSNDVSNLHLTLVSSLTNQTEKVSVQIKLYGTLAQLPSQILSPAFYYSSTLVLFTVIIAFVMFLVARYFLSKPFKLQDYTSADKSFSNSSLLLNSTNSTPKTPKRIVDYNASSGNLNTTITPTGSTLLNRSNRFNNTPQSPSSPGGSSTPSSPKVGRPLFTTRQYFQ